MVDPFFTFGKDGCTGLGLSVSYGIVQRNGGAIDVESMTGEGTTFTITLSLRESDVHADHHQQDYTEYEMSPG